MLLTPCGGRPARDSRCRAPRRTVPPASPGPQIDVADRTTRSVSDVQLARRIPRGIHRDQQRSPGRRGLRSGPDLSAVRGWPGAEEGSSPLVEGRQTGRLHRRTATEDGVPSPTPTAHRSSRWRTSTRRTVRCRNWATASRGRPTASRSHSSRPCRRPSRT